VRAIGYQAIQSAGWDQFPKPICRTRRDNGLDARATHEPGIKILDEPQTTSRASKSSARKSRLFPSPGGIDLSTLVPSKIYAGVSTLAGKALHDAGLILCYHNHHVEFRASPGRPFSKLSTPRPTRATSKANPTPTGFQYGGGDPVAWCNRLKNRLPIIHLKDYHVLPDIR